MFEPFPNYVWNLSVNLALQMGGQIGEIDEANRQLLGSSSEGDTATSAFFDHWIALANRVRALADSSADAGNPLAAADQYARAAAYYMTAERMQSRDYAPRKDAYSLTLDSFALAVKLRQRPCEFVEIPYESSAIPGLLTSAPPVNGRPAPCIVFANGLDSIKEMVFLAGVPDAFRERGVSTLILDQPGVGDSLRRRNLHAVIASERWAGAAVDFLQSRSDVDPDRIGMAGWSLGGYYAPRAAAFEPRFKLCVAWGANHCWGELQKRRLAREGENPVPHYWDHVMWVWDQPDLETYMSFVQDITLDGVVAKIAVPFLITHGQNDRQIPIEYAYRSRDQATASPQCDLKIFTESEGGVEHCSADNMEPVRSFIAQWVADRFGEM